jgi:hypothetical protein
MKYGKALVVAVVWALSLLGVGLWAQGRQAVPPVLVPVQPGQQWVPIQPGQPGPPTVTGGDIGFQPMSQPDKDGRVSGRWMVKIDGEWHEVKGSSFGIVR